jgi:Uma2 family endonuclease
MASVLTSPPPSAPAQPVTPPLQNGDRLTRIEFERRYAAMPDAKKAELIEGTVYMPSPVTHSYHGNPHFNLIGWLAGYAASTPGVEGGDNSTLRLDMDNEPQPDTYLIILPQHGGQVRINSDGYIVGAPELVAEVSASSVSIDLHAKLGAYRRNGVREYIVPTPGGGAHAEGGGRIAHRLRVDDGAVARPLRHRGRQALRDRRPSPRGCPRGRSPSG